MKYPIKQIYPVLFLLLLIAGCIREDLSECPPLVTRLEFAHTTPCNPALAYPADIDSLHLFVFNPDGIFSAGYIQSGVRLSEDYSCEIPLPEGKHTVITWAGRGNAYQTIPATFIAGQTTLDEAVLSLRTGYNFRTGKQDSVLVCSQTLYFGSDTINAGTTHMVKLTKNTTRIKVTISGLKPRGAYRLMITGDDNLYKFDNSLSSVRKINYIQLLDAGSEGKTEALTDMLNPGKGNHPVISILEKAGSTEIFSDDMIKLITENMADANFECMDYFEIDITFDTNMSVSVSVNGWNMSEQDDDL